MRRALAVLAFLFATCAVASAQTTSPISQLPLASPSPGDVVAGVHGGTLGVGGNTSKFLVSQLLSGTVCSGLFIILTCPPYNAPSNASVSSSFAITGTDVTSILTSALAAAGANATSGSGPTTVVFTAPGNYLFNGNLTVPAGVTLTSTASGPCLPSSLPPATAYTAPGCATLFAAPTSTASPFITYNGNTAITNLTIYYPGQVSPTHASPSPAPYPYTLQSTSIATGVIISNDTLVNSYNGIKQLNGDLIMDHDRIGGINFGLYSDQNYNVIHANDLNFIPYWSTGNGYPTNLDNWVLAHSNAGVYIGQAGISFTNIDFFNRNICYEFNGTGSGTISTGDCDTANLAVYAYASDTTLGYTFNGLQMGGTVGAANPAVIAGSGSSVAKIRIIGGSYWGGWPSAYYTSSGSTLELASINGLNPQSQQSSPTVPSSGTSLTNPFPYQMLVVVVPSGVSALQVNVGGANTTISTTSPTFITLAVGQTIILTYSGGTPTWSWVPSA